MIPGHRVLVEAPSRHEAYPVIVQVGALANLAEHARALLPAPRYAIITDDAVAGLFGNAAAERLRGAGMEVELLRFPAGEGSKTRDAWATLTDALQANGFGRDAGIIALGGGVTLDLAGFVAATYMRGLRVLNVPTSLLAMVDASVGGKTGVDTPAGKNLLGAFHAPVAVLADVSVLSSLPATELRYGLAEAVKHGAIADAAYLTRIERDAARLLGADADALAALVLRSVEIKAEVVAADPFEAGRRAVLNFGHTVGHAIEHLSGYAVAHGAAVAIGMVAETRIGEARGVTAAGTADRLASILARLGLPSSLPEGIDGDEIARAARLDKKTRAGVARVVMLERAGAVARAADAAWTHAVTDEELRNIELRAAGRGPRKGDERRKSGSGQGAAEGG